MNKYRPFEIHYHLSSHYDRINRCWGNSLTFFCNARNVKEALNRLIQKDKNIRVYSVTAYHPTVELEYNWTQKFLELENLK